MKIIAITPVGKNDSFANFIIDGLNNLNIDVIATDEGNNVINTYSDDEVIEHSKDADYIFVFSAKHTYNNVLEPKYYLLDKINRPEVTAYLDGSEYNYMYWPYGDKPYHVNKKFSKLNEDIYKKCHKYFKIVVYDHQLERKKLVPCMIGISNHYVSKKTNMEKEYELYCSFGGSAGQARTGLRPEVYNYCLEIKNTLPYLNCVVGEGFDFDRYVEVIRKSYIAISGWGAEQWCRRDFEITSNGTCCFIEKPTIVYPNAFVDGESCVYYSTIEEFKDKLEYYLNNIDECIEIGKNAKLHTEKYHTSKYRIQYIFDNMKK
tara:strand:+ start:31 stop:984 length:954 start_codon:yes stop_codon:yes gene_type:complete